MPDTGASKSLTNTQFAEKCSLLMSPTEPTILKQAGGTTLPVSGSTTFSATLANVTTIITAIVADKLHKNLLISWQDFIQLNVINPNFSAQIGETGFSTPSEDFHNIRDKLVGQFQDTLSDDLSPDPMEIPGKAMPIYLQDNAIPSKISIAFIVPLPKQRLATKVILDLLHKQVITKVTKPTQWWAPGFFVPKPNGTTVCLVTDYTN